MLNKNPKDTTLKNLVDKVRERLAAARDKELVNVSTFASSNTDELIAFWTCDVRERC